MEHEALRRLRRTRRLSQAQLAEQVGVPAGYVARIERGDVESVSPLLERRLARTLRVHPDQIVSPGQRFQEVLTLDNGVGRARRRPPRTATQRAANA